jgi:hypothetical protein
VRIPPLSLGRALEPKRARDVKDPRTTLHERRTQLGRERFGDSKKNSVGFRREAIDVEPLDRRIPDSPERRYASRLRGARSHGQSNVRSRMLRQPTKQLHPRIAGSPGDADTDARISIHQNLYLYRTRGSTVKKNMRFLAVIAA